MTKTFLQGAYGTGKTTQGVQYVLNLLEQGVPAHQIAVIVPQRTLGRPFLAALQESPLPNAGAVDVFTVGGLAQRTIQRFWPLIVNSAGFSTTKEPTFLTIETAQYHMAHFVDEILASGRFDSLTAGRSRLIAQSLDNLAKAAINGFTLEEVANRLQQAWGGHSSREQVYEAWLGIAKDYRQYCYENNLLDFSLQIDVFNNHAQHLQPVIEYLTTRYQHLLADNIEEQSPYALDFMKWIWDDLDSAMLIYDDDAGFRLFLGAEPELAHRLKTLCDKQETTQESYIQSDDIHALEEAITAAFWEDEPPTLEHNPLAAFSFAYHAFYPQMIDWVCEHVIRLIKEEGVAPRDIVILAPYLNDSLRFSLMNRLENAGIAIASHRPSRAIREEPAARAMLTLMQLVNPAEAQLPPAEDVANALYILIADLDPIRARLLTEIVYGAGRRELSSFDDIHAKIQSRIQYTIGERYEQLRTWLIDAASTVAETPPDHFLRRLFGDMVAQPGFGLQYDLDAANVVSQMVESAATFRQSLFPDGTEDWSDLWRLYRELVTEGLLAAYFVPAWQKEFSDAVFIAPAYTYLMRNRPSRYQFWLDVGSHAWSERLDQPLTHPYVIRRSYPENHIWTDDDEQATSFEALYRLVLGLVRRCGERIFLGIADLGEQGFEQRGQLLYLFQQVLQTYDNNNE